jgi:hypothetical protein
MSSRKPQRAIGNAFVAVVFTHASTLYLENWSNPASDSESWPIAAQRITDLEVTGPAYERRPQ